jgi:hypothetical protein
MQWAQNVVTKELINISTTKSTTHEQVANDLTQN